MCVLYQKTDATYSWKQVILWNRVGRPWTWPEHVDG